MKLWYERMTDVITYMLQLQTSTLPPRGPGRVCTGLGAHGSRATTMLTRSVESSAPGGARRELSGSAGLYVFVRVYMFTLLRTDDSGGCFHVFSRSVFEVGMACHWAKVLISPRRWCPRGARSDARAHPMALARYFSIFPIHFSKRRSSGPVLLHFGVACTPGIASELAYLTEGVPSRFPEDSNPS